MQRENIPTSATTDRLLAAAGHGAVTLKVHAHTHTHLELVTEELSFYKHKCSKKFNQILINAHQEKYDLFKL